MHSVISPSFFSYKLRVLKKRLRIIKRRRASCSLRGSIQLTMNWQEADYLEQLQSIERDCRKVPPLLINLAQRRGKAAVSPEVTLLLSMVEAIARRCGEERETVGLWREDGLNPDEVIEEIENELEEVVQTLNATFLASRS